jgi:hypothetical protein
VTNEGNTYEFPEGKFDMVHPGEGHLIMPRSRSSDLNRAKLMGPSPYTADQKPSTSTDLARKTREAVETYEEMEERALTSGIFGSHGYEKRSLSEYNADPGEGSRKVTERAATFEEFKSGMQQVLRNGEAVLGTHRHAIVNGVNSLSERELEGPKNDDRRTQLSERRRSRSPGR